MHFWGSKKKGRNGYGYKENSADTHNMTPHRGGSGKSRKQAEREEFERDLENLTKVTAVVGMQRAKQAERDEKIRKERQERHKNIAEKPKGIEEQFDMMLRRKQQTQQLRELVQRLLAAQRVLLDAPNTDFHGETVTQNPHFDVAVGEMQGWRVNMEDEHVVDVTFPDGAAASKEGLFCVFDGHSGRACATKCRELMPQVARRHATRAEDGAYSVVDFEKVYLDLDSVLEKELSEGSGCTAVTVHVTPDFVVCASVGDSRALLCRDGAVVELSHDHKPEVALERDRIEAAGGVVSDNRVNGQLAMSRAMGDFQYKTQKDRDVRDQLVIALPDVIRTPRQEGDTCVVLACDGIFDVLSNDELMERVLSKKQEGKSNVQICEEICRECLAPPAEGGGHSARPEGTDNMTIMIVDLK